jgi:predicted RNA-binding Zn-ribbon protein involved in translation (DUF1610 family)
MAVRTLRCTPPGPRGGLGQTAWEFLDDTFCPGCGHKGIWREDAAGDYYLGPDYACTACDSKGFMWETNGSVEPHILVSLRAAEAAA